MGTEENEALQAWTNGYEVVAAHSAEHAQRMLVDGSDDCPKYDAEDAEGDGWRTLAPEQIVYDEDRKPLGTVAEQIAERGKPGALWSIDA